MKTSKILSGVIALLLPACSDVDPGPSYFEVTVVDGYINEGGDVWIFIHNNSGEVLDAKPLSKVITRFHSHTPESKISVTIATRTFGGDGSHPPVINLKSYLGVNTPTQWTLKKDGTSTIDCGDKKGIVNISINDPGVGETFASCLSSPGSFDWPDYNVSTSTSLVYRPVEVKWLCDDLFLYVMGEDQQPRYKLLDDVEPGTYNYTMNDLSTFDLIREVSFPKPTWSNLSVKAFENSESIYDPGIRINYDTKSVFDVDIPTARAGYLNRYPYYVTDLDVFYMNSHRFQYSEAPGVPALIEIPFNFNPVVTNKNFTSYQFTANQAVAFRESFFVYFSTNTSEYFIEWSVFADGENLYSHPTTIPDSFLKKYPGFHFEKTEHNFTRFYTEYKSLNELVGELYMNAPPPQAFKYVSKSVFF